MFAERNEGWRLQECQEFDRKGPSVASAQGKEEKEGEEEEAVQPTGGAGMGIGCGFMEALDPHQPQNHWGDVCLHVQRCRVGRLGLEAPNPK